MVENRLVPAKSINIGPKPFGFLSIYAVQDRVDLLSNPAGHFVRRSPLASFDAGEWDGE